MTIAERIRLKREALSLSQEELAKRCGYADKTSISKIENSGDDITLKKIKRIAEALGVSHSYLMGWEDAEGELTTLGQVGETYQKATLLKVFSDYNVADVEKAIELFTQYKDAIPEIQAAVESLLKSQRADS